MESEIMRYIIIIVALFTLYLYNNPVQATNDQKVPIKQLSTESDLAIVGTVTALVSSEVTSGDDTIYVTDLTVAINETLKGSSSSPITVRVPGGTIAGVSFRSSNWLYTMRVGQRAVLFLSAASMGRRTVIRNSFGFLELRDDDTVFDQRGLTLAIIRQQV